MKDTTPDDQPSANHSSNQPSNQTSDNTDRDHSDIPEKTDVSAEQPIDEAGSSKNEVAQSLKAETPTEDRLQTQSTQPQSIKASAQKTDQKSDPEDSQPVDKPSTPLSKLAVVCFVLVLILGGLIGTGGYVGWKEWRAQQAQNLLLTQQISASASSIDALEQSLRQAQTVANTSTGERRDLEAKLNAVTSRLDAHNERLLSLSNTSREDWLLAEAEYLLRLANQRLLVDRSARSAVGLLEAADEILRELAMPDLFPVRQAVAQDLGALKLAATVDREGLYLRLDGLANNIHLLPNVFSDLQFEPGEVEAVLAPADESQHWIDRLSMMVKRVTHEFSQYVKVHGPSDQPAKPLLPPESDTYLKQNLRFLLEQAQLAMLREQTNIYQQSLTKARELLTEFYPLSEQARRLRTELISLASEPVVEKLPDISSSQEQLHAYIEALHQLTGTRATPKQEDVRD
ncbi:uroporphyrinogen-III C-methyltransferase [Marinibactrum halimedae]|uniref:Uroporphyrin-3 C-methyltransferase n=1 Tax=Marinibactrum halimedae TaxID=1444977 RepID=A0AA37TAY8_9GAMM|nr:uroporphyrinogen-III C-methyltransferase [Marinibactrum halimedae]MCD9458302.1 uroporphyrinogen-III C-methyltransferase [Marinibactrum halimedae]GLS27071.1 hypothetical protein GCM10007877_27900 [Marinibactrum halimedae]